MASPLSSPLPSTSGLAPRSHPHQEEGTEANKDCTCAQLAGENKPNLDLTPDEVADQQTFIDNIVNDESGGCAADFSNHTILEKVSTGNFLSINYGPDNFPEVYGNTDAVWRLVDTTGFVKEWTVTLQPAGEVIATSDNGIVEFSLGDAADGECNTKQYWRTSREN